MPRLPDLTPDTMTAAQRDVHASITAGPRGATQGPFTALLHSPDLTQAVQQLGVYIRYNSQVPKRQRELAICLVGAAWKADFEWHVHAPLAAAEGIPTEALAQIARGESPDLTDPTDRITQRFVSELQETKRVSDPTYRQAVEAFGESGAVDLTGLVGYYTLLAMTLNTFEVGVPSDADVPWIKAP
jgi:4-carboxymuconolactone decarboxylase